MLKEISLPNAILRCGISPYVLDFLVGASILSKIDEKSQVKTSRLEKVLGLKKNTGAKYIASKIKEVNDLCLGFSLQKCKGFIEVFREKLTGDFTSINTELYFSLPKGKIRVLYLYLEYVQKNGEYSVQKIGFDRICKMTGIAKDTLSKLRIKFRKYLKIFKEFGYCASTCFDNKVQFNFLKNCLKNVNPLPDLERVRWNNHHENKPSPDTKKLVNSWGKDETKEELVVDQNNEPAFGKRDGVRRLEKPSHNQENSEKEVAPKTEEFAPHSEDTPTTQIQTPSPQITQKFVRALVEAEPKKYEPEYWEKQQEHFKDYPRFKNAKEYVQFCQEHMPGFQFYHTVSNHFCGSVDKFLEYAATHLIDKMNEKIANGKEWNAKIAAAIANAKEKSPLLMKKSSKKNKSNKPVPCYLQPAVIEDWMTEPAPKIDFAEVRRLREAAWAERGM